ncbi:hypothetical protein PIB30_095323 [Stylosanthes scabra]|uniref:Uncharacterized protein n=1 Tax=Stylosanthes scabra TaxID=79078 RepID=A0ABU6YXK5_9FABA|nr:hypothetical protein [Stylosanthes scabra]
MRIYQKENQEIKEIQRRTAEQIAKLYEMMQDTTNQSTQVPPPVTNSLPAQPSQNPKSGINALQHKKKKKGRDVGVEEKRSYNIWYNLIAQLADSVDEEGESEVESDEECSGESGEDKIETQEREKEDGDSQSEEESDVEDEIKDVEVDDQQDKPFFIATLFNNKRVKEEIPAKCEDHGPCLKTEEIFTNVDASVVSVVGIAEDVKKDNGGTPQVLLGRPFLKSGGFKLNYHDEIFTFEVGNTIEIFHFDDSSEPEKKGLHQLKNDNKKKKKKRMAKKRRKRQEEEADKKNWRLKIQTAKSRKDKKKKTLSTL